MLQVDKTFRSIHPDLRALREKVARIDVKPDLLFHELYENSPVVKLLFHIAFVFVSVYKIRKIHDDNKLKIK